MVGLGDFPGGSYYSTATGASYDGSVVTGYSISSTGDTAYIWDGTNGMRNLQTVLTDDFGLGSSLSGWTLERATSVSGDGLTVAGIGINPNGDTEAWVANLEPLPPTVPEPTSLALLATGAFGFMGYGWRRKRKLAA